MFPLVAATAPFVFQLIGPIVISTVVDRLAKFGRETDWTQVKLDLDRKVRDIVPGQMLDETCVLFVNQRINAIQAALMDTAEQQKVLKLLSDGQYQAAALEVFSYAFPTRNSFAAILPQAGATAVA